MNIAIIPARSGSKRIPNKNIKDFLGQPIIGRTIEIVKETNLFEHILVTTDDEQIAKISRGFGAETPFLRSIDLSDDLTPTLPVIVDAIKYFISQGNSIENICCIYPCNPFLNKGDLIATLSILKHQSTNFIFPVSEFAHPIQRAFSINSDRKIKFLHPEFETKRTQDLEKFYHDTGQFYWGTLASWLNKKTMHSDSYGYPIPNWRVVDIDNENDWIRAELLFKVMHQSLHVNV
jgi:pseudaminic acid cytidylyltransferase